MAEADEQELLEQGRALIKASKFKEAIVHFEETLNTLEMTYGEDAIELAECLLELGEAYERGARPTDALRIYSRTLRLSRQVLGDSDPAVIEVLLKLVELNESLGRPADALVFCEQAVAAAHQSLPEDSPVIQQIMDRYHHFANLAGRRLQKPPERSTPESPAKSPGNENEAQAESPLSRLASEGHFAGVEDDIENTSAAQAQTGASTTGERQPGQSRPSRARAMRTSGNQEFDRGRKIKSLVFPIMAAATAIGVLVFLVRLIPATGPLKAAPSNNRLNATESSLGALYHTADQSKKIRLGKNNQAQMISGNAALVLPDKEISNDWSGLMEAFVGSIREKQIWAERKESQLRTEDGTTYYAADGPEILVLAKMARIAGNAQAAFLRTGEFPKEVTSDMIVQYSFQNPLDGKDNSVQIRDMLDDNSDVKEALESGTTIGDEQPNSPCKITCYAVQANVSDAKGTKLKTRQFFIRGCDRYGAFLLSGQGKKVFVIVPSDAYLKELEPVQKTEGASSSSGKTRSTKPGRNAPAQKQAGDKPGNSRAALQKRSAQQAASPVAPPAPPLQEESPVKPTTLWVISNPPCPILCIHYGLALLLFSAAVAAFIVSRMSGSDMRGRTTASGSNLVLIFAAILLLATVLVLAAQLVVFI